MVTSDCLCNRDSVRRCHLLYTTMMTLQTHACASGIDAVSNFIFGMRGKSQRFCKVNDTFAGWPFVTLASFQVRISFWVLVFMLCQLTGVRRVPPLAWRGMHSVPAASCLWVYGL